MLHDRRQQYSYPELMNEEFTYTPYTFRYLYVNDETVDVKARCECLPLEYKRDEKAGKELFHSDVYR